MYTALLQKNCSLIFPRRLLNLTGSPVGNFTLEKFGQSFLDHNRYNFKIKCHPGYACPLNYSMVKYKSKKEWSLLVNTSQSSPCYSSQKEFSFGKFKTVRKDNFVSCYILPVSTNSQYMCIIFYFNMCSKCSIRYIKYYTELSK